MVLPLFNDSTFFRYAASLISTMPAAPGAAVRLVLSLSFRLFYILMERFNQDDLDDFV
jgi:hypothetical protein